ncbi:MAG TPA: type II toxin-antitoxin system Phd/YefM family antitoxin [Gammaproteobacteria bacterium]|nr:type II toxin-antitoxin system Phd/YefM family antitoxin [Gammaproteobacteria bacterium]
MKAISIRDMRSDLGHLDQLIESEGEIIVTKHGNPIARLLPVHGSREMPDHASLRARMPVLLPSAQLVRKDRDDR